MSSTRTDGVLTVVTFVILITSFSYSKCSYLTSDGISITLNKVDVYKNETERLYTHRYGSWTRSCFLKIVEESHYCVF